LILELFQRHLFRHRKKDGQPLAWSGQHLHLTELRAFFSWLAKANHIPFNPASEIELPKQPRTLSKAILSSAEVERILSQPDPTTPLGLRDRAILETLYSTGIRRSELCALRVNDLQWDRQSLFVNEGKGQKDRYVPIGQRALLWITRYIDHARDRMLLDSNEPTLFVSAHGQRLHPDTVTEYTRRYIKAAGITKPGSCHLFRHTMATLMLENGADIRYIQSILGHSKLDTTQIYTRTSLRKLVEVHRATHPAERLDVPP
jgi:integrase/recombinase XerD